MAGGSVSLGQNPRLASELERICLPCKRQCSDMANDNDNDHNYYNDNDNDHNYYNDNDNDHNYYNDSSIVSL